MYTDFKTLLTTDSVIDGVTASNKKSLLALLGKEAARHCGVNASVITDSLVERERLGSTGFGNGVAIPHGRLEGLERVIGVFCRLAQPLAYDAVDNIPVDLVFVLLSPKQASVTHLKALAQVSRALRDPDFVEKLRGAMSVDALYALFATYEVRNAA